MPNPNVRYPLVAIPVSFFEALQRDISEDHDNPYEIVSVNQVVQVVLDNFPMYDYLLRMAEVSLSGEKVMTRFIGDPNFEFEYLPMSLKKVRVTKSQFEMLSQRQAQYASDGLRIPISCIVSSMLFQWVSCVRDIFPIEVTKDHKKVCYMPEAWMYGGVEGERCKTAYFVINRSENTVERRFFTRERDLVSPNVIVGWNPQLRALHDANF